ncbi:MAG TPA: serine hydrolase domain-containing protein [Anaerolineales bacterium]|nr:serine hydrolase domain-containing protein [Anaerolineales bacterium]
MNQRVQVSVTIIIVVLWLLAPMSSSLAAQPPGQENIGSMQTGEGPTDPAELAAFLDQVIRAQMDELHVAGAVVSVVKDGELVFSRGYGLADVAANKPVDPETTLFHLGSIAKTFTFTAVMQLVEQGKLDLNADINTYLDFKIPATYPEPITLAHLMSHSAGMDELFFGSAVPNPDQILPLGEYLRTRLPPRVRPPGIVSAYTNYGVALAGYIVERVSGQPYFDYIEEHVLQPLAMDHTSPRLVLSNSLSQDLSLGYIYKDGAFQVMEDYLFYLHYTPAASIKSTANDMAHYMIAHLQDGAYQGIQILQPETARLMHTQHFAQDPRLAGWAHGFHVYRPAKPMAIAHGGDTIYHHTQMVLIPEKGLGIFVAYNTGNMDKRFWKNVLAAFFDHYFPLPVTPPTPLTNSTTDLRSLAGSYKPTNYAYSNSEKLRMMTGIIKIQVQEDGSLLLGSLGGSQRYVEVEPLFFQRDDGRHVDYSDHFTFHPDPDGKGQYLLFDIASLQKLPWYETLEFTLLHMAIILLVFLSVPLAALFWRFSPRLRKQAALQPRGAHLARWLLGLLVVLYFLSQGGLLSGFASESAVIYGTALPMQIGELLAIPVTLLATGALVYTFLAWRREYWTLAWRIHYTLVTLVAVSVIWGYFNGKII